MNFRDGRPIRRVAALAPFLFWAIASVAGTAVLEEAVPVADDCPALLTAKSKEFDEAAEGFVRVLTHLANSHRRRFHRMDGSREFLLELAECLPEEAREEARRLVEAAGIKYADADNANTRVSATNRLLTAFRGLVTAWNRVRPDLAISLANLHRFAEASAAVETMGLAAALDERNRRPDIELFQDREKGALQAFVKLSISIRFPFVKRTREFFDILWRHLPEGTDEKLKEDARLAIAEILPHDGANLFRVVSTADRTRKAWRALVWAWGLDGDPLKGPDTEDMLERMNARRHLEPAVGKFARKDGGLAYVKRQVERKRGSAKLEDVREFVLEAAAEFLSGAKLREFRAAIERLRWTAPRAKRPSETARPMGVTREGSRTGSPQANRPTPTMAGIPMPGDPESRCIFAALQLLAKAWNEAHPNDPHLQFDPEDLHSPERLFEAFRAMGLDVLGPEGEEADPEPVPPPPAPEPEPDPEPEPLPPPPPSPEPIPIPEPPPEPRAAGGARTALREARVRQFQSTVDGGLAYVRGLVRQVGGKFEDPYFVRDFILGRVSSSVPFPQAARAAEAIRSLPWRADDGVQGFVSLDVADRILQAFEELARAWNEAHVTGFTPIPSMPTLTRPPAIEVRALDTAEGIYRAMNWWGIAGLPPRDLAERAGSGFGH